MATFGFYPGPIDYWMLVTDWRNRSVAIIILAIGALVVGYAFKTGSLVSPPPPPMVVLPNHSSPAIAEGEIGQGDTGETGPARAVQKTSH
jgi:hypothetical protein